MIERFIAALEARGLIERDEKGDGTPRAMVYAHLAEIEAALREAMEERWAR